MLARANVGYVLSLALAATALFPCAVQAADYPVRPVHLLVGLAAGGGTDAVARIVADKLSEQLGQRFIVENRTGMGGNLANEAVINSAPDGYTLLFTGPNSTISMSAYKKLPFDFQRDTVPGRWYHAVPQPDGSAAIAARDNGPGVHRLCQGKSRKIVDGVLGERYFSAFVRRDV